MIKRVLFCSLIVSAIACSKTNSLKNARPIGTDDDAKAIVAHIIAIDNSLNKDFSGTNKTVKDSIVSAKKSGNALLNVVSTSQRNVYSSGTVETKTVNEIIQFHSYSDDVMILDGNMQYYYYYNSRTDYGSSGSANKTTNSYVHQTKYAPAGQTTAVEHPLAIVFDFNGQWIKDSITLSVSWSREYNRTYTTLKTAAGKTFKY